MGSVYNPKDLSDKRRKKIVDKGTGDITPEVDDKAREHEHLQEYDDRN